MTSTPDNDPTQQHPSAEPVPHDGFGPLPGARDTQPAGSPVVPEPSAAEQSAAGQSAPEQIPHENPVTEHPTIPLPGSAGAESPAPAWQTAAPSAAWASQSAGDPHPGFETFTAPAPQVTHPSPHPTSRSGALVAGIAIGALLGGLVGGGTAAIVAANQPQHTVSAASTTGALTLSRSTDVSRVSAVAAKATPSVVTIEVSGSKGAGSGSGVIYSADGYIVTNNHVVTLDGAAGSSPSLRVRLSDGRLFDATVVGTDPFSDLAVVKIQASDLTPIVVADSGQVNVGDLAIAIGAPLNLANTVTSGVVSALYRGIAVGTAALPDNGQQQDGGTNGNGNENGNLPWDFRFGNPGTGDQGQSQQQQTATAVVTLPVIQTDASINPGNSGGALLNDGGELIGINVAIADNGGSSSTAGSDGLGFAIPSNFVSRVADSLIAGKQPSHGLFGASVGDASQEAQATRAGGVLSALTPGGAADRAGLKAGDVITAINGIPVDSGTTASALVRMNEGGSDVTVTYIRNGQSRDVRVTLGTLGAG